MKILELFRRLAYGELSNLAVANPDGTLVTEKHPQMTQYVNEGLLRLYSRFILEEKVVLIEQYEHIISYHLKNRFSESAGADIAYPYIKDMPDEPFKGDVIRILQVTDKDGNVRVLNDKDDPSSLFTPQPDILQVPTPIEGEPLSITYQARHWVLDDRIGKILEQEIDLPFFLEGALQSFVAYKTYSDMNGQENIGKSQEKLAAYEAICVEVELKDLINQSFHTSHTKLEQRGFV
jgi:hypothetical protein